jgi:DNA polymerase-4
MERNAHMAGNGDRIILHCDLNCFFASVELLSHPELRNVPMAVCGDPAERHGIILAKNEPAKRYGIQTAETIWQAQKKCPELILFRPHHDLYREYSKKVGAIYDRYTDLIEPFGIDESWLDITGTAHLFGEPRAIADRIRSQVREELGLTLSVGVSFNKVFAKLGSDYKKPDATTVISHENWQTLVWPLPAGDLLYVGRAAQKVLHQYGVDTLGQLAACKPEMLESLLGKLGRQLWESANGLECEPVRPAGVREPVKSVGNGTTFRQDLTTREQVRTSIAVLSDSVAMRLRKCGMYAGGVQVTIRTPDFKNINRQKQFSASTHLMRDLTEAAMELVNAVWKPPAPIRMLTVTAINLSPSDESFEQVDLLAPDRGAERERQEKLERAMDHIRGKFGGDSIQFGYTAGGTREPDD